MNSHLYRSMVHDVLFDPSVVPQNMDIWAWEKYYKTAKAEENIQV